MLISNLAVISEARSTCRAGVANLQHVCNKSMPQSLSTGHGAVASKCFLFDNGTAQEPGLLRVHLLLVYEQVLNE